MSTSCARVTTPCCAATSSQARLPNEEPVMPVITGLTGTQLRFRPGGARRVAYSRGVGSFTDPEHELHPEDVRDRLARGEVALVDVREQYEWDAGRIAGARHIELERLASRSDEIPPDPPVVFQCRPGDRYAIPTQPYHYS